MQVQPYLFFDGRCDEAIEFYRRVLGAEVTMLMRFKESPDPGSVPAGGEDKVMHANLRIGESTVLASDGHGLGRPSFQGFAQHKTRLGQAALGRIDQEHYAVDHLQHTFDFTAKIRVAGRVDDVDFVFAVTHGSVLGHDGDAALALQVHRVHHAFDD